MKVFRFASAIGLVMLGVLTCAGTAQGAALSESPRPSAESKHESSRGYSLKASKTKPYTPCPSSKKKEIAKCGVIIEPKPVKKGSRWALPEGGPLLKGSGVEGGWSPADLQSAYSIPTSGGETQTVAVVLAYGDETAESDLAEYRKQYGLGSCTKSNGSSRILWRFHYRDRAKNPLDLSDSFGMILIGATQFRELSV